MQVKKEKFLIDAHCWVFYRAGPLMIAINFMIETKYECNVNYYYQIWLQWYSEWGPNMNAISIPNWTIYDCNIFQKEPNMIAMIQNLFSRDSSRNHVHVTLAKFPILQSYLVHFVIKIVIIFFPYHKNYCNHKWSTPITKWCCDSSC